MPYPSPTLYPSPSLLPGPATLIAVREKPPLRLAIEILTPNGKHYRWARDERLPENVPSDLTLSSTMPGGFEQMGCMLPRKAAIDYGDLAEFSTITVYGIGGRTAWQGRLETTPRTSGSQFAITPGAVGWQAALDDNKTVRMPYVDRDLGEWKPPSAQRKLANWAYSFQDASVVSDPTSGQPSLETKISDTWGAGGANSEAWYDPRGVPLGSIYYAWKINPNVSYADTNWSWLLRLADDADLTGSSEASAELRGAGPGTGTLDATTDSRKFGQVRFRYGAAGGFAGTDYIIDWTCLAVYGNHRLTKRGSGDATNAPGFYASDIVAHAVATWAPELALTRAGVSTIEPTAFVIPHITFLDPTTASAIVKEALKYELFDWWVDDGPTFNLASRANHGRKWRARVGASGLKETGPQVDRLYNQVIVSYQDVTGTTRTVGPPGSTAEITDVSLADADPQNPVTVAGLTRCALLTMGVTVAAAAIKIGQAWLAEQKLLSTAGQATLVGHVEDDRGVLWPAWMVQAGDQITFVDAHDPQYRRIVRASYNDSNRACQIDLDSPPQGLQALLARLSVALVSLGKA